MRVLLAAAVLVALQVVGAAGSSRPRTGNLVSDPGLESQGALNWQGSSAAVTRVSNRPHSGRHCLYVRDASDSYGQGNSAAMAVAPGHYYSEAWIRVDPKSPGSITYDIQFFDRDNKYLSSQWMGVSNSSNWTRIRGRVVVPSDAAIASIRLLPAGPSRGYKGNVGTLRGSCFGDDFYFSTLKDAITAGRASGDEFPGVVADPIDYDTPAPMRPHLYLTARKVPGLLSVAELRQAVKSGHRKVLWNAVRKRADDDLRAGPIVAGTDANWIVCNDASQRILRASLAFLITADDRYKESALRQIAVTFDTDKWPKHWRDDPGQPRNLPAGLRVGQLCAGIGLAYDWLHAGLTAEERKWIVAGLNRQGIQPFLKTVKQGNWQVAVLDNFMPNIVGGVGLAGMGLAEDHPDSGFLVRTARQRMKIYLSVFGPEGEWNESVGYSNSVRDTVEFYSGLRYWTTVRPEVSNDTTLASHPFPQFCRWKMYMTLPTGREAKIGNCSTQQRIVLPFVPAIAAANRDGVLQWFYLNHRFHPEQTMNCRDYLMELLTFDSTLKPVSPEGRLPHGHAFTANTMCVSSRTNWSPKATRCVVYGKGGAAYEIHGHHDVGQVCIDGNGERLIVEQVGYDGGYVGGSHDIYSAGGHNVLTFNGKDMITDPPRSRVCFDQPEIRNWPALRSRWLARKFDDRRGGYWLLDSTEVYEDVKQVRRLVVHLNPGVVVVLDTATLLKPGEISLRWHTVDKCRPDRQGHFVVRGKRGSRLAARVTGIGEAGLSMARREHKHSHGSYVEASLHGDRCSVLSLFCIFQPGEELHNWKSSAGTWSIQTATGTVDVRVSATELSVNNREARYGWTIPLPI